MVATCFNTASVLIQPCWWTWTTRFSIVSIQLLFLFNISSALNVLKFIGFNTASVLIQPASLKNGSGQRMFQYSFCSYSTFCLQVSVSLILVSIQLLFLFNYVASRFTEETGSFNTASVLIQPPKCTLPDHTSSVSIQLLFLFNQDALVQTGVLLEFQYSFCSYSTYARMRHPEEFRLFQYSFCSYSTAMLHSLSPVPEGFNTASVLIQPSIFQYSL